MSGKSISITGELMGRRVSPLTPSFREDVVRITVEGRPDGPAENSIILIKVSDGGGKRARYLSWIGYHDLDVASMSEPGAWRLVEPASLYREEIDWNPFN